MPLFHPVHEPAVRRRPSLFYWVDASILGNPKPGESK